MTGWPSLGRSLTDAGGNWEAYLEELYAQYLSDFHTDRIIWPSTGLAVSAVRAPEEKGKSRTFWHMISEGYVEADREIAFPRCERISWPRQIIDAFFDLHPQPANERICWWRTSRTARSGAQESRVVIALEDFSYVVVLADRGKFLLFWTAYPVEYANRQRKHRREFEEYWRGRNG
jgi:hypothetical protein